MRKQAAWVVGLALVLAVASDDASAKSGARKPRPEVKALLQAPSFADAGDFSGALSGVITLNGVSYRLTSDTRIYEVGRGLVPVGTDVSYRRISIKGITVGDERLVSLVIVRPAGRFESVAEVRIMEKDRPR